MTFKSQILGLLIALLGFSACIIDTVPLPDYEQGNNNGVDTAPSGAVNANALYYSASPALLIGSRGAATPLLVIDVINANRPGWRGQTLVSADGSFNLPYVGTTLEVLEIRLLEDERVVDSVALQLQPAPTSAYDDSQELNNGGNDPAAGIDPLFEITAPDANGVVTLRLGYSSITPGMNIVVANVSSGNSAIESVQLDGSWVASIVGNIGDQLTLLLDDANATGAGIYIGDLIVPRE